ncbi:unnamed protein product [Blumeria hordei]|uniref:Uncharacterized protein n=1 Tax=Blumeria hordei TaxID=2867405 RepID=A0A383UJE2_BLUHO|nr:unnamed protein product [Blumeria hordei]
MMRFLSRSQVNSILVLATPIMLAVAESGRGYKCEKTFFKPEEINDVAKTMKALMKSNPDVPCSERKSRNLPECVRNWPKPGSGIRHSFPIKKHSRSVGYHDAGPYRVLTDLSGEVSTLLIVNQGTWKDCTPAPIYASNDEISYEIDSDNDYEGGMESCMRRFQKNCGFIKENRVKLRKNCGKIINNCGIIEDNYGQVVNNYGIIRKNHEGNEGTSRSRCRSDISEWESIGSSFSDKCRQYRNLSASNSKNIFASHNSGSSSSSKISLQNQGESGSEHQIGSRRSPSSNKRYSRTSQGNSMQNQRGSRVDPGIDHEISSQRNPESPRGYSRASRRTSTEKQGESESGSEDESKLVLERI